MEFIFALEEINGAAEKIALLTSNYKVFAIHGAMGAGKTTFIHAWCRALGVSGHTSSPTFSIINQYTTAEGKTIYHMDLYRIKDETEAIASGVEDCFFSGDTCLVEWPEKAPGIFPDNTMHVFISPVGTGTRKISIGLL